MKILKLKKTDIDNLMHGFIYKFKTTGKRISNLVSQYIPTVDKREANT